MSVYYDEWSLILDPQYSWVEELGRAHIAQFYLSPPYPGQQLADVSEGLLQRGFTSDEQHSKVLRRIHIEERQSCVYNQTERVI